MVTTTTGWCAAPATGWTPSRRTPGDGIVLWEYTDQPGVQVYTGNFLVGTSGHAYRQGDAFTLETQHFPDTPHHIGQPGRPSVVLNPGQVFGSKTTYKFTTAGPSFQHNF